MLPLDMLAQRGFGVKGGIAVLLCTGETLESLVLLPNMFGEGVFLPKALPAVLTPKPFCTFVNSLVALQTCSCDKALATAFSGADMFPFLGVGGLDVLLQMFVDGIVFCAAIVRADEWPRVGV
jgi:hypothetical protein